MNIIAIYAALLGLIFAALSARTIRLRRRYKVAYGISEHPTLARAVRAHGHFSEYVPMALLLLGYAHLCGANQELVHTWGTALVLGRGLHGFGLSQVHEDFRFRVAGMVLTNFTIMTTSLFILISSLF